MVLPHLYQENCVIILVLLEVQLLAVLTAKALQGPSTSTPVLVLKVFPRIPRAGVMIKCRRLHALILPRRLTRLVLPVAVPLTRPDPSFFGRFPCSENLQKHIMVLEGQGLKNSFLRMLYAALVPTV